MARLPRIVLPGIPHHVTQCGNRRQRVFFGDDDFARYLELVGAAAANAGTEVLAYCLMPNHVHFVVIPHHEDGLRATFGEAHRRYTAHINARKKWTGHLWQGRFASVAMDDAHCWAALRYLAFNPVLAKLAARPEEWFWSSAKAHVAGVDDAIAPLGAVVARTGEFAAFLHGDVDPAATFAAVAKASSTGRPVGSADWMRAMEDVSGLALMPGKRGPSGRTG